MAKQQNNSNLLMWIVLIIVLIYGGKNGWFNFSFSLVNQGGGSDAPQTPLPDKVTPTPVSYNLRIDVSPSSICTGDLITGTITSNIYNGVCSIFSNTGAGYTLLTNANLNANGGYSQSSVISSAGTSTLVAVCCDANNNCKLSNTVTFTSRVCDCVDTDGQDNLKPGWVTSGGFNYYDDCAGNWAVTEYYCNNGVVTSKVMACNPGYICYETRSGDYCKPTTTPPAICTDTDGGNILTLKGTCTDADSSTTDLCPIGNFNSAISEGWCQDNVCIGASTYCPSGTTCYNGACISTTTDSDHDGWNDVDELEYGTNPNDASSHPPSPQDEVCNTYCGQQGYSLYHYDLSQTEADCVATGNYKCNTYYSKPMSGHILSTIGCCCINC